MDDSVIPADDRYTIPDDRYTIPDDFEIAPVDIERNPGGTLGPDRAAGVSAPPVRGQCVLDVADDDRESAK